MPSGAFSYSQRLFSVGTTNVFLSTHTSYKLSPWHRQAIIPSLILRRQYRFVALSVRIKDETCDGSLSLAVVCFPWENSLDAEDGLSGEAPLPTLVLVWFRSCLVSFLFGFVLVWFRSCLVSFLFGFILVWFRSCLVSFLFGFILVSFRSCFVSFLFRFILVSFCSCFILQITISQAFPMHVNIFVVVLMLASHNVQGRVLVRQLKTYCVKGNWLGSVCKKKAHGKVYVTHWILGCLQLEKSMRVVLLLLIIADCVMAVNDEKRDPEQPWGYINYNSLIQHTTAKKWKTMVFCHCSCSFMYHVHLFLPPSPSVLNCIIQHTQVKASAISTVPVENICTVLYVVCGLHLVTTCCSCLWLAAYICSHFLFYCAFIFLFM